MGVTLVREDISLTGVFLKKIIGVQFFAITI